MGNQKNARKKIPTAKKLAENDLSDSPPSRTLPRPKPKPTGKAATSRSSSRNGKGVSEFIAPTSRKTRRSVTWVDDNDVSMVDCDARNDEAIEQDYASQSWDDLTRGYKYVEGEVEQDNEDEDEDDIVELEEEVEESIKRHIAAAQSM